MINRRLINTICLVVFIIFTTQAKISMAAGVENYKVVDGIAIYIGIVPAEIILGHEKEHPESKMHGGVPNSPSSFHLLVALFDNTTGKRITNAQVTANISNNGQSSGTKQLDPMNIANTITYGNYFTLGNAGEFQIKIEIRQPGIDKPIIAEFQHTHVQF